MSLPREAPPPEPRRTRPPAQRHEERKVSGFLESNVGKKKLGVSLARFEFRVCNNISDFIFFLGYSFSSFLLLFFDSQYLTASTPQLDNCSLLGSNCGQVLTMLPGGADGTCQLHIRCAASSYPVNVTCLLRSEQGDLMHLPKPGIPSAPIRLRKLLLNKEAGQRRAKHPTSQ